MGSLDRRSFLIGAGAAVVAIGGGSTAALLIGRTGDSKQPAQRQLPAEGRLGALAAILGDPAAARRVGAVYIADEPSAPQSDPLEGVLTRDPRRQRQSELAQPVRDRAHVDFQTGNTVEVAGWILPRSVAELCAVAQRELG